jgi:hypothetical protein
MNRNGSAPKPVAAAVRVAATATIQTVSSVIENDLAVYRRANVFLKTVRPLTALTVNQI